MKTHRRRWLSVAAGISTAYVFVQLFPEMSKAQEVFTKATAGSRLPFAEQRIYTSAPPGEKRALAAVLLYFIMNLIIAIPYMAWRRRTGIAGPTESSSNGGQEK